MPSRWRRLAPIGALLAIVVVVVGGNIACAQYLRMKRRSAGPPSP